MSTVAQRRAFVTRFRPYAAGASADCHISVATILSQWALESGWGTSSLAVQCHNLGGIRFYGHTGTTDHGGFACYPNFAAFTADYVHTMMLPYYSKVRAAVGVLAECSALGKSPYDAGHYGTPPGANLVAVYHLLAPYLT